MLPSLSTVISYSSVSPGETRPLEELTSVTVLIECERCGAAVTLNLVGSLGAGVDGSSVSCGAAPASSSKLSEPWLETISPSVSVGATMAVMVRSTSAPGATLASAGRLTVLQTMAPFATTPVGAATCASPVSSGSWATTWLAAASPLFFTAMT